MRLSVPKALGIALVVATISTAGLFLIPSGKRERTLTFRAQQQHPVTPSMEKVAKSFKTARAPEFRLEDLAGQVWTRETVAGGRPLLVFFVEKECPCCLGAKPHLERVFRLYKDSLSAVAVINADRDTARLWQRTVGGDMTVLCDPDQTAIRAYGAERGVSTTLIDQEGRICAVYPGYSQTMLLELGEHVAKLASVPVRPFDTRPAPEKLTSGCLFP